MRRDEFRLVRSLGVWQECALKNGTGNREFHWLKYWIPIAVAQHCIQSEVSQVLPSRSNIS